MPYYIRVLGTGLTPIPLEQLRESVHPALLEIEEGAGDAWSQVVLKHESGQEIAIIERNLVSPGELGDEEIKEFLDEVAHYRPATAVAWRQAYLPSVKVIFAFQLLDGTDVNDGWTPLHAAHRLTWKVAGGILQADREGFTNEEGYTILWQFGDTVSGTWNVSVLINRHWTSCPVFLARNKIPKTTRTVKPYSRATRRPSRSSSRSSSAN